MKRLGREHASVTTQPETEKNTQDYPEISLSSADVSCHINGTFHPVPFKDLNEVTEGFITCAQLHNTMNDGQLSPYQFDPTLLLIVDTRDLSDYKVKHIATAVHVTDLGTSNKGCFGTLDVYTKIVLYDEEGLFLSLEAGALNQALLQLNSQNIKPLILHGGFNGFNLKHPYLCTSVIPTSERERQSLIKSYPSIILEEKLFLGTGPQACNENIISDLAITHIVNVCKEHPNAFPNQVKYLHLLEEDESATNLLSKFTDVINFIENAFKVESHRVLVHCNLGQSRSSTLVIAYLMYKKKWTLHDAYKFTKEKRPIIQPNDGFLLQLCNFEEMLFGEKFCKVEDLTDD